jgi:hypothetical protein
MSIRPSGDEVDSRIDQALARDIEPLLEEAIELLDFDYAQGELFRDYLIPSWISGARAAHEQLDARAKREDHELGPIAGRRFEGDMKNLMVQAAAALTSPFSVPMRLWEFMHEAWTRGNDSTREGLKQIYLEINSDIPGELDEWLRGKEDGE